MTTQTVQMKVSGLMCSFCTMSLERALKRYAGVKNVMVNCAGRICRAGSMTANPVPTGETP